MAPDFASPLNALIVNIDCHLIPLFVDILHIISTMRNKVKPAEATEIGARIKGARLRLKLSISELGSATGVHHSQISRCERGEFKTTGGNVQKLCKFLKISHPKLSTESLSKKHLRDRMEALIDAVPGSAVAFTSLLDVLEVSLTSKSIRKRMARSHG
jgi:transcriptional regulator with XRE-family HTH domain